MDAKRVLIIRLSAIGDVIMATPMIKALKEAYPGSSLSWLVEGPASAILEKNPMLDEVIVWPKARWKEHLRKLRIIELLREVCSFRRGLRDRKFDLVLDAQGLLKSGLLARLSGARQRVGLASKEGSGLLMTKVVPREGDRSRIGSEYLHLIRSLGIEPQGFEMNVAISDEDRDFADKAIEQNGLTEGFAVMAPFTTRPQKHWRQNRWRDVADGISAEFGLPAVVLGGPSDVDAAKRIEIISHGRAKSLAGTTTMRQAAAIIQRCNVFIGVDTGLTHMAIAMGVPVVAIFGATCPYTDAGRDGVTVLYRKAECSPCRRSPNCHGDFHCMKAITSGAVLTAINGLLRGAPKA